MTRLPIQWAAGTVAGRDHRHAWKNSHDAWAVGSSAQAFVAVVCDGCGSGEHSEVGAWITAQLAVKQTLVHQMKDPELFKPTNVRGFDRVRGGIVAQLGILPDFSWSSASIVVSEFLLSTVLGVLITEEDTYVFGSADGIFYVNGSKTVISKDNKPPYLAYALTGTEEEPPSLELYYYLKTRALQSILLGTDGAVALAEASDRNIPGKEEKIGPISQFWERDVFFRNPFAIGHRLNLINRSRMNIDYESKAVKEEHGPLADDTTLVVVRRT